MTEIDVKVSDLKEIMELKNAQARDRINQIYGSMDLFVNHLKTNLLTGLTGEKSDLEKRVRLYGKNEIPPKPPKSIFRLAFEQLKEPLLILLIVCGIISIGLSFYHPKDENVDEEVRVKSQDIGNLEWVEGVAIAVSVIVVVGVSSFNDWRKERKFRGLQDRIAQENKSSVIRNGQVVQINVKELVVGDICCVKYGDLIPADGIVTQASDLKIDEASLTGETDLIKKNDFENVTIFSGTHVMEGTGQFLVTAVGLNSQTGIIMTLLGATSGKPSTDDDNKEPKSKNKTPKKNPNGMEEKKDKKQKSVLQSKLTKLVIQITYIGITAAVLTFLILLIRMLIVELEIKKNKWNESFVRYILSYLIQGITVMVVAVPEGLPLAVTLALAFAVQKMTKDNNLVRHLDACETMGNATTICSDKTGTLTTNRMTAVQCWVGGIHHKRIPEKSQVNEAICQLIYESASVNSNYTSMIEPAKQDGEMPKQIGNKTECALLGFVNKLGGNYEQIRALFPNDQFVKVYTFNSARKMMSTIVNNKEITNSYRMYSKGASEMVLAKCGWYLNSDGKPIRLSADKIDDIVRSVVEPMAMNGLRTICVASRDFIPRQNQTSTSQPNAKYFDQELDWDDEQDIITDLTCLCLVGIEDPVRPEVLDAIRKCQTSGVTVRMVTGDNINTATSIAMKCGIVKPGDDYLILESQEFNKKIRDQNGEVKQDLLDKVWPQLRVLARSSPTDKYILVNGIVESKNSINREVVAVTGDGTNDGPALKRADVGFAMGIQGTDVAKEASDIILTDDNFSSIVKALMWGRNVYDAIAKFLQFQLTVNFVAGVFSVTCAAAIQSVPLKAVQMLWVNLVMDSLASLALATEPPTEDLLKRKPYGRTKHIVSLTMMKNIVGQSIYQLAVLYGLSFGIESWMSVDDIVKYNDIGKLRDSSLHFTIIFNVFVIMTLFNEINARKLHNERNVFAGIQNNYIFMLIWVICLGGQILIVNFGGIVFSVKPLEWDHWMWSLFLGTGTLLWQQVILTVPDSFIEKIVQKICCCFYKTKDTMEDKIELVEEEKIVETAMNEQIFESVPEKESEQISERTRTLWMIANKRIQTQLQFIKPILPEVDESINAPNHTI